MPLLEQERGDQEAAQREEDVDSDEPAAGPVVQVDQHYQEDRDAPDAVELRAVAQAADGRDRRRAAACIPPHQHVPPGRIVRPDPRTVPSAMDASGSRLPSGTVECGLPQRSASDVAPRRIRSESGGATRPALPSRPGRPTGGGKELLVSVVQQARGRLRSTARAGRAAVDGRVIVLASVTVYLSVVAVFFSIWSV